MGSEFITARQPGGQDAKTQTIAKVRDRLHKFVRDGEKARFRLEGGDYNNWQKESDVLPKIIDKLEKQGVGPKTFVQRENDMEVMSIREITKTPDLGAAPAIEAVHAAVWGQFDVRSGGLWLCRYIDGTHSVSKHGYLTDNWKGAAEDIFPMGKDGGSAGLVKVANFVIDQTKRGNLNAEHVIWLQRIWEPGVGEHVYGGITHYHVHVDVPGGWACHP